jgi:hypothetical protein
VNKSGNGSKNCVSTPKLWLIQNPVASFIRPLHPTKMVDYHSERRAHKTEGCPACKGMMRLVGDTYACEQCGHFRQDTSLQSLVEREDRANLKFCKCEYCLKQ